MQPRLSNLGVAPDAIAAVRKLSDYVKSCGLEPGLLELVKIRASQINGCAFCIHMHTRDARARGETEERLYLLDAWRESPLYSARERAALAWTDALTRIAETHASDEVYAEARAQFSEEDLVKLTVAIGVINAWNRLLIGFRVVHPVAASRAA
jgi:AhpD family alkylhydroperoxidase